MQHQATSVEAGFEKIAGKYLSFLLGNEEFAIEILKIKEIIALQEITPLPRLPDYVKGVINLRGRIIPVVDLRNRLGMPVTDYDHETCIIVIDVVRESESESIQIGVIVDSVREVLNIGASSIEAPPKYGSAPSQEAEMLLGIGKLKEGEAVVALLDIDSVLSNLAIPELAEASE